ncbi:MAG: two-component system sensor histidine kinase FlrB [Phenylobacterium sp.]|jgi:two-component system sensor histidine kinase FlrB
MTAAHAIQRDTNRPITGISTSINTSGIEGLTSLSFVDAQVRTHQIATPMSLEQEAYPGELAELREKAGRLSHLVDTLPAGVIILDSRGCVADSNQVALDMLGQPLGDERWIDVIKRSFSPKSDDGHEVSLKDGRRIKLSISSLDPHPGQLILMADLTETRLIQERMAHMKRLSSLGKMVASLAHQVRTPLSAAMLYAANMANERISAEARSKFSGKLCSRLQDLEQQVSNMLLFAKSGGNQVAEELSLQQLLSEVRAGAEAMVNSADGHISVALPEPDILIRGNKSALASAIQNLILNSLQLVEYGAEISICVERDPLAPEQVIISVADNGPGVDESIRQKIFEPFYTTKSQGTGLGLSVVQAIAHSHNGKLTLADDVAQGAKFNIHLPTIAAANEQQLLELEE